jgi:hypothetical protein
MPPRSGSKGALTFLQPGTVKPHTKELTVRSGEVVTGTVVAKIGDHRTVQVKNVGADGLALAVTVLGSF